MNAIRRRTVLGALLIRRWAFGLLSSGKPCRALWERVRHCPPAAWRTFLETERCALAIQSRLVDAECLGRLPDAARAEIDHYRIRELKRALSARAQLQQLASIANSNGYRIAVLKGGVAIVERRWTDVADVDVLVSGVHAQSLASMLDELGFRSLGWDPPVDGQGAYHLAQRLKPYAVQVEIHFAIHGLAGSDELLARSAPIPDCPGLWKLGPADHLFHLLFHTAIHHPERLGCIRDLELIAATVDDCHPEDLQAVKQRIDSVPEMKLLHDVVAVAESLVQGSVACDPWSDTAAARYLVHTWPPLKRLPEQWGKYFVHSVFHLLRGPKSYSRWIHDSSSPSSVGALRWLNRHFPGLAWELRAAYRTTAALSLLPTAWLLTRCAAHLAEVAGEAGDVAGS